MAQSTKAKPKNVSQAEQLRALRRVLRLLDGYISTQDQDLLLAYAGGLMTWRELRRHIRSALKLPVLKQHRKVRN